jgi:hypothetical protein
MKNSSIRKVLLAFILVVCFGLVFSVTSDPSSTSSIQADDTLALIPPQIIQVAAAENAALASIQEEAGFSAWYSSTFEINLNNVRSVFRTIEIETTDYIIGSVPVPDYHETADPHVYVNRNGWMMAYYEQMYPVSKAIDARAQSINNTKLETVLGNVAGAAGVGFTGPNYYDFRYPNATDMIFIAEHESVDNEFCLEVPSSYSVFERSWSLYGYDCVLDGTYLENLQSWNDGGNAHFGPITASQLAADERHCVHVNDWCAFVIVYRIP